MNLQINGEAHEIESSQTITDFLERRGLNPKMIVVERNRQIVPRNLYSETILLPDDELEIVQMMAGG